MWDARIEFSGFPTVGGEPFEGYPGEGLFVAVDAGMKMAASNGVASVRTVVPRVLFRSVRPKQWLKNVLVFAAPAAAGVLLEDEMLARAGLAFVVFCLVASGTYLINDVIDVRADRLHAQRRLRPVASGELSTRAALIFSGILLCAGVGLGLVLGQSFELLVLLYVAATISYSLWLKNVAVIDLGLVASFYVIRALAGGAATGIAISPWFLALTSAAAFFVVAGKRYSNHVSASDSSDASGVAYSQEYLRYVWMMGSGLAIAAYALWAFAQPHVRFEISWSEVSIVPFALAILRYALVLDAGKGGAPEDVVLGDRPLQILFAMWLIVYAIGVYAHG